MPIDYKNYNHDFKELSKKLRTETHTCEECGAKNYLPHPITGSKVVLTVHHLNGDTKDDRRENLKVLCQKCHLAYHKKVKKAEIDNGVNDAVVYLCNAHEDERPTFLIGELFDELYWCETAIDKLINETREMLEEK